MFVMADSEARQFRFDCGATWLNFLATTGRTFSPEPVERLDTLDRLAQWFDHAELTPARPLVAEDLARSWDVRETLRAVALAVVEHRPPPAQQVHAIAEFLVAHAEPVRLSAGDRLRRDPPQTAAAAVARIVGQAVDHLAGADRAALKSCPEHDCRGIFTDPVGRRRWCPSAACASRGRVRAMRARQAAGSAQAVSSGGDPE